MGGWLWTRHNVTMTVTPLLPTEAGTFSHEMSARRSVATEFCSCAGPPWSPHHDEPSFFPTRTRQSGRPDEPAHHHATGSAALEPRIAKILREFQADLDAGLT